MKKPIIFLKAFQFLVLMFGSVIVASYNNTQYNQAKIFVFRSQKVSVTVLNEKFSHGAKFFLFQNIEKKNDPDKAVYGLVGYAYNANDTLISTRPKFQFMNDTTKPIRSKEDFEPSIYRLRKEVVLEILLNNPNASYFIFRPDTLMGENHVYYTIYPNNVSSIPPRSIQSETILTETKEKLFLGKDYFYANPSPPRGSSKQ